MTNIYNQPEEWRDDIQFLLSQGLLLYCLRHSTTSIKDDKQYHIRLQHTVKPWPKLHTFSIFLEGSVIYDEAALK